ncbi:MAG: ParB/RepB/Spo0J family partition protein [Patescibacteria group bacterium]|nr:ParB/RepB/Spo0J family partition protein [Patescibacteria group bacterium]
MLNPNNKTLGRGLSSLIGGTPSTQAVPGSLSAPYFPKKIGNAASQIIYTSPTKIKINPHQPRQHFNEAHLNELMESIRIHGIIQPLTVTQILGGGFELVAGERRLRAAQKLGLKEVPVIVRSAKDLEKLELSLIENIQRQDLNAMEKAEAYQKMVEEFSLTHDEAAKRLGISRATFSNFLRLLTLPVEVQKGLGEGKISLGQAKVMLEMKDGKQQEAVFRRALQTGATVIDTKREVQKIKGTVAKRRQIKKDPFMAELEEKMQAKLNTKVRVRPRGKQGGVIEIEFYSEEELSSLANKISR